MSDDTPCAVYVIEISPRWFHLIGRAVEGTEHLYYVGSTDKPVDERVAHHLRGTIDRAGIGANCGRVFKRIRVAREAAGIDGALVAGEDAWLVMEMVEAVTGKDAARAREGVVARALRRRKGVAVFSDKAGRRRRKRRTASRTSADDPCLTEQRDGSEPCPNLYGLARHPIAADDGPPYAHRPGRRRSG